MSASPPAGHSYSNVSPTASRWAWASAVQGSAASDPVVVVSSASVVVDLASVVVRAVMVTIEVISVPELVMNAFSPLITHSPAASSSTALAPSSRPSTGTTSPGRTRSRSPFTTWSIDGSVNLSDDSAGDTSERYQLQGNLRQFHRDRNFYLGFGSFERNTELDLNLRTMAGGGYGRYFVQTNHAEWLGGLGMAYSHENYTGGETFDSVEGVLTTSFKIFRYDFPETDIGGSLTLLPSLTKSGRYRAEADLRAKYEFVDDLYFELKVYGSYDSEPPLADSEQSDYGLTTSLGYSF